MEHGHRVRAHWCQQSCAGAGPAPDTTVHHFVTPSQHNARLCARDEGKTGQRAPERGPGLWKLLSTRGHSRLERNQGIGGATGNRVRWTRVASVSVEGRSGMTRNWQEKITTHVPAEQVGVGLAKTRGSGQAPRLQQAHQRTHGSCKGSLPRPDKG